MKSETLDDKPWWKFGHVWMIIGGPLVVIVASVFTGYLAMSAPDPVLDEDYYRKGLEINKHISAESPALAPAVQARNHIGTGGQAPKHEK